MRRLLRYPASLLLALLVVLGLVIADVGHGRPVVLVAIAVVYGSTTSLALAHPDRWLDGDDSRVLGAVGGGVGAFGGSALINVSVPAGVLGLGLFAFGLAVALAGRDP